ncbi:hypothetical protein [Herbaspirillum sp. alder98]|uniref:hypothetical protein n=1 Tax=Herbaspirillum sp. alder98 TaxID=2913096 RepID=UPI001CD81D9E|nr:hypothetical protein [Herbaspirillum sp. alder98]MCA1326117.1 hypothetical protein [Herbaspirillum sp. alder98]
MNSIASISVSSATLRSSSSTAVPVTDAARSASTGSSSGASSRVTLSQTRGLESALYSSSGISANAGQATVIDGSGTPSWERTPGGELDALLARNAAGADLAGRFSGLGRALLKQAGQGGGGYSQSLLSSAQAMQSSAEVQAVQRLQLHDFAADAISLSIVTASGAKVEVKLSSDANGVALAFSVSQGALSDEERAGLADLGDALQSAIDGLAQQPPQLDLDALMQARQKQSSLFAAFDLHATLGGDAQKIDLHVDADKRELSTTGNSGNIKLSVDLSNGRLIGSAQQRQGAVASYLGQFDEATRRGHGDAGLMAMFKQGFAQLNGVASQAATSQPLGRAPALFASVTDRGILSGLQDFTASVTQAIDSPNPLNKNETDSFSYTVSQHTTIGGRRQADRAIDQRQESHLSAAYHEALQPDLPLKLGTDRESQNYTYHQIEDKASSALHLGYQGGLLTRATLQQSASQNTTVSKYVLGQRVRYDNTPLQASIVQDLTAQLQADAARNDVRSEPLQPAWSERLQRLSSLALLVSDPTRLPSRQAQLASA